MHLVALPFRSAFGNLILIRFHITVATHHNNATAFVYVQSRQQTLCQYFVALPEFLKNYCLDQASSVNGTSNLKKLPHMRCMNDKLGVFGTRH